MRRVRWPSTTAAAARFQSPCSGSFSLSLSSLSESKRIASSHVCSSYPSSAWRAWCFELLARENEEEEEEEEEEGVELLRFFSSSSFDSTSARLALFFRRTSSDGKKKGSKQSFSPRLFPACVLFVNQISLHRSKRH